MINSLEVCVREEGGGKAERGDGGRGGRGER